MPSKGQPLHRRKRNLQKSRSRFVGNERRQKNSPCIVGNQTPRQSSFGRAREGRNPLAPRPRGGVGERSAPRPRRRERKSSREPFLLRRKRTPSKEQPCIVGNERRQKDTPCIVGNERRQKDTPCIVGNQTPRQTSPGRAREGRNPLAPRPRGNVGEQSAPRSRRRERKISREQFPLCRKRTPSKEQPRIVGNERRQKDNPCIVGNERRQKDNPLHRRKPNSPPDQPRESARGTHPSRTPSPEGV